MASQIDGARRILVSEPVGGDKVADQYAADVVPILVVLDRIADLARPEGTLGILVSAVQPWVDGHLADLVARADAETRVIGLDSLGEHLGDR